MVVDSNVLRELVRDEDGQVSAVKLVVLFSKLLIFVLGVLCTILLSQMGKASEERADIKCIVQGLDKRVSIIESSNWTTKDQASHETMLAQRFESVWARIIALEARPLPETPPVWFKEQVNKIGNKVDENTRLLIQMKAQIENKVK